MNVRRAWDLVEEAKGRVTNLAPDEVERAVAEGAALVDLRESEEREEHGVIPGSIHAPRGMLEFYADPTTPFHKDVFEPDRRIILHCAAGGRSALAAYTLRSMGYEEVAHLEGGLEAWKAAAKPVSQPHSPSV